MKFITVLRFRKNIPIIRKYALKYLGVKGAQWM